MNTERPAPPRDIAPTAIAQLALPLIGQRAVASPSRQRLAKTPALAPGDRVVWTLRANGRTLHKEGVVQTIIPAGQRPDPTLFPTLRIRASQGYGRATPSYIVRDAQGVLFWPIATHLQRAR